MTGTNFRPKLERLEGREVPAAAILSQGTLYVTGTDQSDIIRIAASATDATKIDVTQTTAGVTTVQSFVRGGIENLVVRGKAGSDYIRNDTNLRSAVFGGKGNDTIWGGSNNDLLFGNEGNDRLYGGAGNDLLDGGIGDDQLFGLDGMDRLIGRLGNDLLDGGKGNDRLDGGAGADTILGGVGNDAFIGDLSLDKVDFNAAEDAHAIDGRPSVDVDELVAAAQKLEAVSARAALVFARASVLLGRSS